MSRPSNLATPSQLLAGTLPALQNASRLVKDAKILRDAGSAPTAHSLAVLAVEEASKSYSWSEAAINSQGSGQVEVPIEGSHAAKITRARSVLGLIEDQLDGSGQLPNDEILARAKDLAKDDNAAKQRGFYVDLEDGVVKDPGGIVPDEATAMIEMAETVIGMALAGALYHGLKKPGTAGG